MSESGLDSIAQDKQNTNTIDYLRQPQGKKIKEVSYTGEKTNDKNFQKLTELLGEQYFIIGTILGLTTDNEDYIFIIEDIQFEESEKPEGWTDFDNESIEILGYFDKPNNGKPGVVALSKPAFDSALEFLSNQNNFPRNNLMLKLVRSLAHELYHRRQYEILKLTGSKDVPTVNGIEPNRTQRKEVGADMFAQRYIDFLLRSSGTLLHTMLSSGDEEYSTNIIYS